MLPPEIAFQLALGQRQAGRLAEAEALLRQVVAAMPNHVQAWHQLGLVVLTLGRPAEAVELIGHAIALRPGEAPMHSDCGVAHYSQGHVPEAIACFESALRLQPNLAGTHRNLGDAYLALGRTDDAIASYRQAIALTPGDAGAHNNLGNVFLHLRQLEDAAACYERAVQLEPRMIAAQSNLGDVMTKLGHPEQGLACAQRVVALDPNFADGYLNMGVALWRMGRFPEAEACARRAIALRPDLADAHLNLGVLLLLHGQFEEGWREYEWHWRSPKHASRCRDFSAPPWEGAPIDGKTILTYADQGFGDTLHFVRYLPLLLAQSHAARVIVEVQGPLIPLLQQLGNAQIEFVARGETLPEHDHHVPLFNLPLVLRRFEPLAISEPYLHADEQRRAAWRARLGGAGPLRVGIAWAGNPLHTDDRGRSMPAEKLQPILDIPGVTFVSLQFEPRPLPPALAAAGVLDIREHVADFSDSAALLAELDLVISVDTSPIHLAGALGRPVWVLLAFVPDWRWGLGRADTPWYPTMRLFRQPRRNDWGTVMEEVAAALHARLA